MTTTTAPAETTDPARPTRTAGYARVSTKAQDLRGQIAQLRAAGCTDVRAESTSGAARRPVLDALIDDLGPGDVLTVTALDRLGRVGVGVVQLVDQLQHRGVGLRVLRGGLDTTDPVAGRVILFVLAAVAEAERTLTVERTRAGLAAAKAAGRTGGRPTVMSTDRLDVARRLVHDGSTIATAARVIGVSRSTLSRHLN